MTYRLSCNPETAFPKWEIWQAEFGRFLWQICRMHQIVRACEEITAALPTLDILLNNAEVLLAEPKYSD